MDANEAEVARIVAERDGKPKRGPGRPPKEPRVTEDVIADMASVGCTWEEMETLTGLSRPTLENRYLHVIEKGRAELRQSLRHKQVQLAKAGDKTMLIWLGKQLLGQSEAPTDVRMTHRVRIVDDV